MRKYRVANKHDLANAEKCPQCLSVFQHFMDLGDGLFGCFRCGTVFVSKPARDFNYSRVVDQLKSQQLEVERVQPNPSEALETRFEPPQSIVDPLAGPREFQKPVFMCTCGKKAKSKAGLSAHKRASKNVECNIDTSEAVA